MGKKLTILLWVMGIASVGFLISGLICEYAAIWTNQWATQGETGMLSNMLQSTAFLNIVMFVILGITWLLTEVATDKSY